MSTVSGGSGSGSGSEWIWVWVPYSNRELRLIGPHVNGALFKYVNPLKNPLQMGPYLNMELSLRGLLKLGLFKQGTPL